MTAVILCMAGLYRRFREAGYETPKFLLPYQGRTILEHVAAHLPTEHLLLVANRRDEAHADAIGRAVPSARTLWVGDTAGQAETAAIGAREAVQLGWDEPLVFHNIDTIIEGRDLEVIGEILREASGYIDVFRSESAAYSYVQVDETNQVQAIAEKVPISPWATTGLYGFSSAADYLSWYEATRAAKRTSLGEFYISDVYGVMLDAGRQLMAPPPETSYRTTILGTPAEYEAHTG